MTKIEELNLSIRSYNILKRNGINTLEELLSDEGQKKLEEISEHKCIIEIKKAIEDTNK